MQTSFKLTVTFGLVLASPWLLNWAFGWFSVADVERATKSLADKPWHAAACIIGLLAIDSVLAVPSLVTVAIGGHLLGAFWGAVCGLLGLVSAGAICFFGARHMGIQRFLTEDGLMRVRADVGAVGPGPLLFARAVPVLPEALSAMAGVAGMRARTYFLYFTLGQAPFAIVGAWAGSKSTPRHPWPAVTALVVLLGIGAIGLHAYRRRRRRRCEQEGKGVDAPR